MIKVRKSEDRGAVNLGWLDSRHSFSFGHYYDPNHMGLGPLRVINEDRVQPGNGFDTHGHRDMEIISYVLEGALEHKDSMGTGSIIRPGDVQRMTAGTGVRHSEYNPSDTDPLHFLQIWIVPEKDRLSPNYEQKHFDLGGDNNGLVLIGSREGRNGSIVINQDVDLFAAKLKKSGSVTHQVVAGRQIWLQIVRGAVTLNLVGLTEGDGAAISDEENVKIEATEESEILLFDMA